MLLRCDVHNSDRKCSAYHSGWPAPCILRVWFDEWRTHIGRAAGYYRPAGVISLIRSSHKLIVTVGTAAASAWLCVLRSFLNAPSKSASSNAFFCFTDAVYCVLFFELNRRLCSALILTVNAGAL